MRGRLALGASVLAAGAVLLALGGPLRAEGEPARPASAATGADVFVRMGCGGCHRLAAGGGSEISVGPDLDDVLPGYDTASLRAKIVDPYPAGAPADFVQMPQDFGSRMTGGELDDLVAFLLATVRR